MIRPEKAWKKLAKHLAPMTPETLPRRSAAGRVLARDLAATLDVPGTDVSAMDGYATAGAIEPGTAYPVVGTVAAGDPPGLAIDGGQAAKIMTGATLPAGADRVIQVELSDAGDDRVAFTADTGEGAHIRRAGEILRAGDPLLPSGSLLTPGAMGLVATHGYAELEVVGQPRVAVLTTGDEVIPPEATPRPGQLRDSNTDALLASGRGLGLELEPLGTARDTLDSLRESIRKGLEHDVLLLCGGVSKGEFDYVEDVLDELGCQPLFDAVAIQPGKPLVAAVHDGGLVFGLPGNPASVMACFWLFVRPALRRMMGYDDAYWHGAIGGELAGPLPGAKGRDRFLAAEVAFADGVARVLPIPNKGSHDVAFLRVRHGAGAGAGPRRAGGSRRAVSVPAAGRLAGRGRVMRVTASRRPSDLE